MYSTLPLRSFPIVAFETSIDKFQTVGPSQMSAKCHKFYNEINPDLQPKWAQIYISPN